MMSLRAVHAGTGYQYLLRSVATHDAQPEAGQSLADYYAAKGTPPGRWIGTGCAGLESDATAAGHTVDEAQMAALYGEGLHPDTDAKMRDGTALVDCKLGRAFPIYTGGKPVLEAIAKAEKTFQRTEGRRPTVAERGDIAESVGRPFYLADGGFDHASGADVIAYVNRERDQVKQAVAGFDFTFSPVKSVSVLWALADENTASQVAALHHEAVAEALAWAETNAIYTRTGAGGIQQVRAKGLIGAEFTHFDTRGGDPDLHSHVLLANKVQDADGNWKALDGQAIFQMHQAISSRYDTALHDRLSRHMGLEFTARYPSPDKAPVWEVAGVDRRLCEAFSSRRRLDLPVYDELVSGCVRGCGRQPSQRASYALWQKAILVTRDAKKPAQSLAEHRRNWQDAAADIVGPEGVGEVLAAAHQAATTPTQQRPLFHADEHAFVVAETAIAGVTAKRAQFRRSHVDTAVSVALKGYRFGSEDARKRAHDGCTATAMAELAVQLTPPETLGLPARLRTESGVGIDRRANAELFSTRVVLDAETRVTGAAQQPVAVLATHEAVHAAGERFHSRKGWGLNDGQRAMVEHLATAGTLVAAGVGPAGTGKSAAMAVLADAWQSAGHRVIGLAPSAAAGAVLAEEIGSGAHTIDQLVFTWRGHHPTKPGGDPAALPVTISPGDMLLVDEAGMASTDQLAALTEIADATGAVVRLVGDPSQLSAVAGGGIFAEVCQSPGTPELRQVMRMGSDTAQAAATLALREGTTGAVDLYDGRGWVCGGAREAMLTAAAGAYLADTAAGRSSLVIAATNSDVDTLNELIRAHHVTTGQVDTSRQVSVARGDQVGVGDTVVARTNRLFSGSDGAPAGRVRNGQLFTVTGITGDGSLAVRDRTTGHQSVLPADYTRDHVHLGYAATVHRAQGATVDTSHCVIDGSVDRAGLYVALTRGRHVNRTYAVCEATLDPFAEDAHQHSAGDLGAPTARQVLERVLARDTRMRSATETLREEMAAVTAPERLAGLYARGVDLAARAFTAETLNAHIEALPRVHSRALDSDPEQREALAAAWTAAATAGHDPRQAWAQITADLDGAARPGRLLAHRLREYTGPTGEATHPTPPPRVPGDDAELAAWLSDTHRGLTTGADEPEPESSPLRTVSEIRPGARVTDMDLSHCDLRGRDLTRVEFQDCDLTGTRFDEATLKAVTFMRCTLDGAAFTGATASLGGGMQMRGCSVDQLDLQNGHWTKLFLDRCTGDDLAAAGSDWRVTAVRNSHLSFNSSGALAENANVAVEGSTVAGFDALGAYSTGEATDLSAGRPGDGGADAVAEGREFEAARERVESSAVVRLTDEDLDREYRKVSERVDLLAARLERERAREQRRLQRQREQAGQSGAHERRVRERQGELDAHAEAVRKAMPLHDLIAECERRSSESEHRHRQADLELGTLGPLAIRRRKAAEERRDTADLECRHYARELDEYRAVLADIHPDPGPRQDWPDVLSRAADTRARQRELDNAVEADRRAQAPVSHRQPIAEDRKFHTQWRDRVDEEIHRRRAQTPGQRIIENAARQQYWDRREAEWRADRGVPTAGRTTVEETPAAGWSASTPDAGPDLGP